MKRFLLAVALGTAAIVGLAHAQLKFNPNQVAILRWYPANQAATFDLGLSTPFAVAFDGANVWVPVFDVGGSFVYGLRASDGLGRPAYPVGNASTVLAGIAFDGANLRLVDNGNHSVIKRRARDANVLGTFPVGNLPRGVAFDGANIWVANALDNTVTKLRAIDGTLLGTFPVGGMPVGVAFDGADIWVTNSNGKNVTKLRASDGHVLGTFAVGRTPEGVAFDGANIWGVNRGDSTVTKLRASDGAVLGTFKVGNEPIGLAFDGANIWVVNWDGTVSKL